MFSLAGRLKPKGFQRRFAYFLDGEKVCRRRLNQPKGRYRVSLPHKRHRGQFDINILPDKLQFAFPGFAKIVDFS